MFYLAWRVMKGLNTGAEINFLIAGHTKFMCDQLFGLVKKRFRRTLVSCLQDVVNVSMPVLELRLLTVSPFMLVLAAEGTTTN